MKLAFDIALGIVMAVVMLSLGPWAVALYFRTLYGPHWRWLLAGTCAFLLVMVSTRYTWGTHTHFHWWWATLAALAVFSLWGLVAQSRAKWQKWKSNRLHGDALSPKERAFFWGVISIGGILFLASLYR